MDYNESAHRVDKEFDQLFRELDVLEQHYDNNELSGDCTSVIETWKAYKKELKRHMEAQ